LVNYYPLLGPLIGTLSALWIGYRIAQWRLGSKVETEQTKSSAAGPHNPEQLRYRARVRNDLTRIRAELYKEKQEPIQFESWDAFPQPDTRQRDLNNDAQFTIIQNLSHFLNERNNHLNDVDFQRLSDECVAAYLEIQKIGFLDADNLVANIESYEDAIAKAEPVRYYPITHVRKIYRRATVLDTNRLHLHAYMFFGLSYYLPILSKLAGKHRDMYTIPRKKLIVNTHTMSAYHFDEYLFPLLWPIVKIRWESRFYVLFSRLPNWCKKNKFTYHPWGAEPNDLL
jgi:hypothetical protein